MKIIVNTFYKWVNNMRLGAIDSSYAFTDVFEIRRVTVLLFLTIYIGFSLCAQQFRYLDNFNTNLSSQQSYSIVQDTTSIMWISTKSGIDRYDGSTIKHYPIPTATLNNTLFREFLYLQSGHCKNVLAFSERGQLYKYSEVEDDFKFDSLFYAKFAVSNDWVRVVYVDKNENIWIGTKQGLFLYANNEIIYIDQSNLIGKMVVSIEELDESQLFVATEHSVYLLDTKSHSLKESKFDIDKHFAINTLHYNSKENNLWIGTFSNGAVIYNTKTLERFYVNAIKGKAIVSPIRSIKSGLDNTTYLGVDGMGLIVVDSRSARFKRIYQDDDSYASSIRGNGVYGICVDKVNNVWITTFTGGVSVLLPYDNTFDVFKHEKNNPNSLINDNVNAVFEDSYKNLWFGTDNGVSCFNVTTHQWFHLLQNEKQPVVVLSLEEDVHGRIWVGSYAQGLFIIANNKVIDNFTKSDKEGSLPSNYIFAVYKDKSNRMWVGGRDGEYGVYSFENKMFNHFTKVDVNCFYQESDTSLLIASNTGLYSHNLTSNKLSFRYVNESVFTIFERSGKEFLLGTRGNGITELTAPDNKVIKITSQHGLASDFIYSIEREGDNFWFATEKGLSFYTPSTKSVFNYTSNDGISNNSFNPNASCKTFDGKFIFGSLGGVTIVNPSVKKKAAINAKISITEFQLQDKPITPLTENSPLTEIIDKTNRIELPYNQNAFSFFISSVSYFKSEKIEYQWKMDGFDASWNRNMEPTEIKYSNLISGDYTLQINIIDSGTKQLLDARTLHISIGKPWWRTVYAYIFILCINALALRWLYLYYKMRIERKSTEEKVKFFSTTAHDLGTPLSLIKAPLEDLSMHESLSVDGARYLSLALSNTNKVIALFNQLLDFQREDMVKSTVKLEYININSLISRKVDQFSSLLEDRKLSVNIQSTEDFCQVSDSTKLERVVENLLSNAIKYSNSNSVIEIVLEEKKEKWTLLVKDEGIGISKESLAKLFTQYYRGENAVNLKIPGTGLGLILVKKFVSELKGKIEIESKLNEGTSITIQFKKNSSIADFTANFHKNDDDNYYRGLDNDDILAEKQASQQRQELFKIVVVEDNDDLRNYLKETLSVEYTVFSASNGKSALDLINKTNPDLVISDIKMEELDGLELAKSVKSKIETSHIPFIILSALSSRTEVLKGLEIGIEDYITKPFDVEILKLKIHNLLEARKSIKQKVIIAKGDKIEANLFSNNIDQTFVEKALKISNQNIANADYNINQFASDMGVSKTILYNKLNALVGQTPNNFLKIARLKQAEVLLKKQKYTISEISIMVGMEDPKYFSSCFKAHFNVSPAQYLKEI